MPLKANTIWSRERCDRKVNQTLAPVQAYVGRHRRVTARLALAFVVNVCLALPFFAGMPWHRYWGSIGSPLLLLCLIVFIALVFEAGWTLVQWQNLRELRKAEWAYLEGTRKVEPERS